MTHPEAARQPLPRSLESLQTGRYNNAVALAERRVRESFDLNGIENPHTSVTSIDDTSYNYDCGVVAPSDLLSFEAVGIDTEKLLQETGPVSGEDKELIAETSVAGENLEIRRMGRGITLRFSKDGHEPDIKKPEKPEVFTELIRKRFVLSPAHREVARVQAELEQIEQVPGYVSTNPINPLEDPLGTAVFLDQVDFSLMSQSLAREIRSGAKLPDLVLEQLIHPGKSGIHTEETESTIIHSWGKGVVNELVVDKESGMFAYAARADVANHYLETPDQSTHLESIPFVETECARELSSLLERAGLMFHPTLQLEMMSMNPSDRYGAVYTQMTREVAKWTNSPDRLRIKNLFVPFEAEYQGETLAARNPRLAGYNYRNRGHDEYTEVDVETSVRDAWQDVDHTVGGEAAGALVQMIDDALARDGGKTSSTDLPVTERAIYMTDGACFDVAAYYMGAAGENMYNGKLRQVYEDGVDMLEKTDGAHTFLSEQPMVFNGVRLPKGALFTKQEDGWAFLRLTPFSFDDPVDRAVFDPELVKAVNSPLSHADKLGEITLDRLVDFARLAPPLGLVDKRGW